MPRLALRGLAMPALPSLAMPCLAGPRLPRAAAKDRLLPLHKTVCQAEIPTQPFSCAAPTVDFSP